jgi:hypothetical protein
MARGLLEPTRMRLFTLGILVAASAASVRVAAADRAPSSSLSASARPAEFDLGVRIGGYGFKREGDDRPGEGWTECRMDGFGVFGSRVLRGPLFVEAGLDVYGSSDVVVESAAMDLPIDRTSGLLSVAGGVRTQIAWWLRGYLQIGAGVELTRVSVPYGDETVRDTKAMPEGFFGFGLELRVLRRTHLGASFRTLMMGNFDYSRAELEQKQDWGFSTPDPSVVFDASLDFAAQGQFYLRRDL